MNTVNFNANNAAIFVSKYNKAIKDGKDSFLFREGEYVTRFAYYLIQHLCNEKIISGLFNEAKIFVIIK